MHINAKFDEEPVELYDCIEDLLAEHPDCKISKKLAKKLAEMDSEQVCGRKTSGLYMPVVRGVDVMFWYDGIYYDLQAGTKIRVFLAGTESKDKRLVYYPRHQEK